MALFVGRDKGLVDDTQLPLFRRLGLVSFRRRLVGVHGNHTDQDHLVVHHGSLADQASLVQIRIVVARFHTYHCRVFEHVEGNGFQNAVANRPFRSFAGNQALAPSNLFLFVQLICTVVRGAEEAALQGPSGHQDRVFHIVAGVGHDGDHGVFAVGVLFLANVAVEPGFDQGDLATIQHQSGLVEADAVVGVVEGYGLFGLGAGEGITGDGVVFEE